MKSPFFKHITKIRNPRGKVKHSIIYFQQFIHFFLLKTRQKNGRSVYLVQTVRSPLTDHVFIPFAPSVYPLADHVFTPFAPSVSPLADHASTPFAPSVHPLADRTFTPFAPSVHPSQTEHLPHLHRPSPPSHTAHLPRLHHPFLPAPFPVFPYPFISNNELLYISNEYIIYSLTSHSASAIP